MVSAAVIVTVSLAPGRSVARRSAGCRAGPAPDRAAQVRATARRGRQPLPVQRNTTPRAARRVAHRQQPQLGAPAVDRPVVEHERRSSANGSGARVAVLVDGVAPDLERARAGSMRWRRCSRREPGTRRRRGPGRCCRARRSSRRCRSPASRRRPGRSPGWRRCSRRWRRTRRCRRPGALALGDDVGEVVADGVAVGAAGDRLALLCGPALGCCRCRPGRSSRRRPRGRRACRCRRRRRGRRGRCRRAARRCRRRRRRCRWIVGPVTVRTSSRFRRGRRCGRRDRRGTAISNPGWVSMQSLPAAARLPFAGSTRDHVVAPRNSMLI